MSSIDIGQLTRVILEFDSGVVIESDGAEAIKDVPSVEITEDWSESLERAVAQFGKDHVRPDVKRLDVHIHMHGYTISKH